MRATCLSHLIEQNMKTNEVHVITRKYIALVSRLINRSSNDIMKLVHRRHCVRNRASVHYSTLSLNRLVRFTTCVTRMSHFSAGGIAGGAVACSLASAPRKYLQPNALTRSQLLRNSPTCYRRVLSDKVPRSLGIARSA
jgi:hypothetical protein